MATSTTVSSTATVLAGQFVSAARSSTSSVWSPRAQEDSLAKMQLRVQNTASVDRATVASCLMEIASMTDIEAGHHVSGLFALYDTDDTGEITWKDFINEWTRIQLFNALRAIRDGGTPTSTSSVARSLVLQSIAHQLGSAKASEITDKLFSERDPKRTAQLPLLDIATWYFTHYGPPANWQPKPPTVISDTEGKEDGGEGDAQPIADSIIGKWRSAQTSYGLVFVDDELFIGDMPSGGFAGEYSADIYNGSLKLTVQQHRPVQDKLSDADLKWMESLSHVTRFQCPLSTEPAPRILLLSGDGISDFELKEEQSDESPADIEGGDVMPAEKPKKTKKPSAIVEEAVGEGDESFDF